MHVLIASSELQCSKLSSSPLPRLLSNIPRPPPPQPPECMESHLWTEETGRKGRKRNGILLFVTGKANAINSHSVHRTPLCTNPRTYKYSARERQRTQGVFKLLQHLKLCIIFILSTKLSRFETMPLVVLFRSIHTLPIVAATNEYTACLLAPQACVITHHNNQFIHSVTLNELVE